MVHFEKDNSQQNILFNYLHLINLEKGTKQKSIKELKKFYSGKLVATVKKLVSGIGYAFFTKFCD